MAMDGSLVKYINEIKEEIKKNNGYISMVSHFQIIVSPGCEQYQEIASAIQVTQERLILYRAIGRINFQFFKYPEQLYR